MWLRKTWVCFGKNYKGLSNRSYSQSTEISVIAELEGEREGNRGLCKTTLQPC